MNSITNMKKAVLINAVSKYSNIIISLVVNAILARLISPQEYGLLAIITVFSTFFSTLSDVGFGTAIIQNRTLDRNDIQNIYNFTCYISFILMLLFGVASFAIAEFYNNERLIKIGLWMSIPLLFNSLNMVPNGILNLQKKFLEMALRNTVVYLLSGLLAVIMAFMKFGIYAVVIQSIISSFAIFVWSKCLTHIHFTIRCNKASIKKIASYSGFQYAFTMINYFSRNLDNILVGKVLGENELAYYNRAYSLMLYPVQNISGVITPVLHPIYSDYQDDKEYIYLQYIKLIRFIAVISVFVQCYCFVAGDDLIRLMYGENWINSITCFKILSFAIITQMVTNTSGSIFQALGQTKQLFIAGTINMSLTILSIILGLKFGESISDLAFCVAVSYIFHFFISYFVMIKYGFDKSYKSFLFEFKYEIIILLVLYFVGYIYPFPPCNSLINLILKLVYLGFVFVILLFVTKEYKCFEIVRRKK